ncbi:hypothetical protein BST81_04475 [Leptolyngbya sp. 'hensonii']|uniref:Coq4 family protein n=1 Tax=Leptolyngbya sp. 'hensonii' TaxID=1922337 RepID=UPI00094FA4BD|nr:Coq4 family protein [Leptolyngbya sp. 'hensonii']OLP19531.1 hypothetical protein BST81_04475 [Leptolyngbya sp. 'hensonii']
MLHPVAPHSNSPSLIQRWADLMQAINPLTGMNWSEVGQAYRVFLNHPSQGILHILAAGQHSNWTRWVAGRLARQAKPLANQMIQLNLAELAQLPPHTLGYAYACHILDQGFDPEAFSEENDTWLGRRMALSHDVHHVITGFDSSPIGEFGLAAFVLIQYRDLLNVFVLSHLPWYMMGHPGQVLKTLATVLRGFRLGFRVRPLIAYPFEANWHKPLNNVRQELGIT